MQEKMKEMHEEILHIQNTAWAAYKKFLDDPDAEAYTDKMAELVKEYRDKDNQLLLSFAENESVTWCPVINWFAEEFSKGGG